MVLVWWSNYQYETNKSHLAPKRYDVSVENFNKEFESGSPSLLSPYELPFLKIKSIFFSSDNEYLYLKFSLGGVLPQTLDDLSSYQNDRINSIIYKLYLDENYFDLAGNKNPGGPEAELKMDFYGNNVDNKNDTRINVKGELLKGGPGKDYFVVRYPYYQLLLSQNDDTVVFSSYASSTSLLYPDGASKFIFSNPLLAATPENSEEIRIDLSIKSSQNSTIENTKY